jgi:hypothetical protein
VSGDTLRWRGVLAEDRTGAGLTIADLRAFIADADALAAILGVDVDQARPLVADYGGGAIRHLWVGVSRRSWRRWRHEDVVAGPTGAAAP